MSGSESGLTPSDVAKILQCAWAYSREGYPLPGVSTFKMWEKVVLAPVKDIVKKVSISHITRAVIPGHVWHDIWLENDGPGLRELLPKQPKITVDETTSNDTAKSTLGKKQDAGKPSVEDLRAALKKAFPGDYVRPAPTKHRRQG